MFAAWNANPEVGTNAIVSCARVANPAHSRNSRSTTISGRSPFGTCTARSGAITNPASADGPRSGNSAGEPSTVPRSPNSSISVGSRTYQPALALIETLSVAAARSDNRGLGAQARDYVTLSGGAQST